MKRECGCEEHECCIECAAKIEPDSSKSALAPGLSGPLTIPVKTVREALDYWLHIYIFKDDVKIKTMKFKTDGQVEITFE